MSKTKVALCGYGFIGKGVIDILSRLPDYECKYIFDIESKKNEIGSRFCNDIEKIVSDDEIKIVFEAMGGDTLPYQIICSALKHGKNVITSNKETVSKHIDEYETLADEHNCHIRFEASVGGGIPIIADARKITSSDEINEFRGILNGTTNYILTRVFDEGMNFKDAVQLAVDKGFAEKDPTADLNGSDITRKGIILKYIVTGKLDKEGDVLRYGIENLDDEIIEKVKEMKMTLKLVVSCDGGQILIMPRLLTNLDPLTIVKEEFNAVALDCMYNGPLQWVGKGAGRYPTAASMIQDLVAINEDIREALQKENKSKEEKKEYDYLVKENGKIEIRHGFDPSHHYPFIARIER